MEVSIPMWIDSDVAGRITVLHKYHKSFELLLTFTYVFIVLKQAVRFYGSFDVTVTGITIQNSPQCHLKFDNCVGVSVYNFKVSSPGDSPNTDGIHLQNSKDVLIHTTDLSCGNSALE